MIARGVKRPGAEVELSLHARRMDDVGKLAVPESILRKPSSLDQAEWRVMRTHSTIGSAILDHSSSEILQAGHVIALHHHERWDGGGYPDRISGDQIPFGARIIAVADSYDAMTSDRPYRRALSTIVAMDEIVRNAGIQFDPQVVEAFQRSMQHRLQSMTPPAASHVQSETGNIPAPDVQIAGEARRPALFTLSALAGRLSFGRGRVRLDGFLRLILMLRSH